MNSERGDWIGNLARFFSVVFHPLFIPLYGLLIIYSSPTLLSFIPFEMKRIIFVLVTANNIILPLSVAAILYSRGAIKTFNARDRNERVLLLTFALMMYSVTAVLLMKIPVPNLFKAYFISIAIVTLITLVITAFYRLSLHAAGIGGLLSLVAFMILLYNISSTWQLITVLLLGGAVMSSRIYLDDHKPSEIWSGLFIGGGVMSVALYLLLK
ncbi:MAG: hypothetical protein MUC78_07320 [Bacteroidales bacterium]|jgi:hypothetical protein|nr:hypothetical protein [Bacteroidales bacterium]